MGLDDGVLVCCDVRLHGEVHAETLNSQWDCDSLDWLGCGGRLPLPYLMKVAVDES